jgi:cell division protein FtsI (penicillin-binding protein 3)
MSMLIPGLIGLVIGCVVCFPLGIRYRKNVSEKEISSAEEEAKRIINDAIKSAESKKREAMVEAKEEILKSRSEYDPSSLGSMAFGQGITFPMVQMVRAVGSIANGGLLKTPHFVTSVGGKQLSWPEGERSVSEGTAEKVADMMRTVVEEGTGTSAAVEGYDVAAKTGTGEQAENGTYLKGKYLASLIGFAPARDPEVLVYVGLNETPYLSYSSAGPAFSAIMGEVLADMGILSTSWGL